MTQDARLQLLLTLGQIIGFKEEEKKDEEDETLYTTSRIELALAIQKRDQIETKLEKQEVKIIKPPAAARGSNIECHFIIQFVAGEDASEEVLAAQGLPEWLTPYKLNHDLYNFMKDKYEGEIKWIRTESRQSYLDSQNFIKRN